MDLKGGRYAWECPIDFTKTCHLTIDDINVRMCSFKVPNKQYVSLILFVCSQETIKSILAEKHEEVYMMYDEKLFINLQACIRGFLLRKRIADRYAYFNDNLRKIIMIQAWWRGVRQRKQYRKLLKRRRQNMLLYQSKNKLLIARTNDKIDKLSRYKKHVSLNFLIF